MRKCVALAIGLVMAASLPSDLLGEEKEEVKTTELSQEEAQRIKIIDKKIDLQQKQIEQIRKQHEFIRRQQEILRIAMQRPKFPVVNISMDKKVFAVGDPITFKITLKNGSRRTFSIDGRKLIPGFEVIDQKGKVVLSGKEENRTSPLENDFIPLGPGKEFSIAGPSFVLPKEGAYKMRGIYTFTLPEGSAQQPEIWSGKIVTPWVPIQVKANP